MKFGSYEDAAAVRDALIACGLLRPQTGDPRRYLTYRRRSGPVLEMDDLGRAVAAARVSGELDDANADTSLASWLRTDLSRPRRVRRQKGA